MASTNNGTANGALAVIAAIAVVGVLHWAAAFFIPLFVALLLAYALAPLTDVLTRFVRWRVVSASLVVTAVVAAASLAGWAWSDDIASIWQRLPEAARMIADSLKKGSKPVSPMAEVKRAADEIEAIAQTGRAARPLPQAAAATTPVSFWQLAWAGGRGAAVVVIQTISVLFLVFFMLASGDLFKRKIVRIAGPRLAAKKITLQAIDEIDQQIRRYLVVMLVANLLVGLLTWIAFRVIGVEYAELWGLAAGIIHTAPYFGPAIIAIGSGIAALLQFGEWSKAVLVAGVTIGIATLVGSVFATWLSARQTRMNTTATFAGLLFFGWLWGLWGVLLAIPLLAVIKAICERTDDWKPIAELLSREDYAAKPAPAAEENAAAPSPRRDKPSTT